MNDKAYKELQGLRAALTYYRQRAKAYRFGAPEHLLNARWYEAQVEELQQRIAELEARDG